jgi:hypothetical protein
VGVGVWWCWVCCGMGGCGSVGGVEVWVCGGVGGVGCGGCGGVVGVGVW